MLDPKPNLTPEMLAEALKDAEGFPSPMTPHQRITHIGGTAKYHSPTKKNKEQSKKKRLMAKASRKANRRK